MDAGRPLHCAEPCDPELNRLGSGFKDLQMGMLTEVLAQYPLEQRWNAKEGASDETLGWLPGGGGV